MDGNTEKVQCCFSIGQRNVAGRKRNLDGTLFLMERGFQCVFHQVGKNLLDRNAIAGKVRGDFSGVDGRGERKRNLLPDRVAQKTVLETLQHMI